MINFNDGFARRVADFVLSTQIGKLSEGVKRKARLCLVDCLGCMAAGSREEVVDKLAEYIRFMGGNPVCSIPGRPDKTSPYQAAMINGAAAHILDYDDVSPSMTGHPSVVVLPAVLAAAEEQSSSGADVLEAYIIGVEICGALGRGFNPAHYSKGWHTTSTLGVFGATAAVCKILGLNKEQIINAVGIAASESSGLKINFGTMTKSFHAGRAAAKGVMAAYLAKSGFTSSEKAFEGKDGFALVTTGGCDMEKILITLGNPFEFEKPGISLKPYTSCKGTHNGIDAMLALARENNLIPEEVEKIECGVLPVAKDILIYPRPRTGLEGKFSMNFCVALALVNRDVKMDDFSDETVADPRIASVIEKVSMDVDPGLAKNGYFQGTWDTNVKVTMKNGKVYEKLVIHAKGDAGNPFSEEEIFAKFADCAGKVMTAAKAAETTAVLKELEKLDDIRKLTAILRP